MYCVNALDQPTYYRRSHLCGSGVDASRNFGFYDCIRRKQPTLAEENPTRLLSRLVRDSLGTVGIFAQKLTCDAVYSGVPYMTPWSCFLTRFSTIYQYFESEAAAELFEFQVRSSPSSRYSHKSHPQLTHSGGKSWSQTNLRVIVRVN